VNWWVLGAWIGAIAVSAVVLAFCAYELIWKGRRLSTDLERLSALSQKLTVVQGEIEAAQAVQQRLAGSSS
jgi:outer membrane murein-binding lipoprotein Lpp